MKKMLKKTYCIVILLMITGTIFSQDIIVLKDGREVKAKVVDIGDKVIKYKKFDNLEGPSYSVETTEITKIKYKNGTEDVFNAEKAPAADKEPAAEEGPSIFTGKFDIEDEATHDYLEGVAKNAGARILEKCAGRVDNYTTEIYWDQVYRDEITKEINVSIIVKWEKGLEGKQRWVRGVVKLDKNGKKLWSYQGDGGITFSGCAKSIMEL